MSELSAISSAAHHLPHEGSRGLDAETPTGRLTDRITPLQGQDEILTS